MAWRLGIYFLNHWDNFSVYILAINGEWWSGIKSLVTSPGGKTLRIKENTLNVQFFPFYHSTPIHFSQRMTTVHTGMHRERIMSCGLYP
jgi:hypothetical protein